MLEEAKKLGMVRVVDESGEDSLFPKDRFISLARPSKVAAAILQADARREAFLKLLPRRRSLLTSPRKACPLLSGSCRAARRHARSVAGG